MSTGVGIGIGIGPFINRTPSGTSYLLDDVDGAVAAYSTYRLSSTYEGSAIRVARSSDSAEADIGFVDGALDTASLLTFVGAGSAGVVTWYDQSGNGRNLTHTTATAPVIVTSGVVETDGQDAPALFFDNAHRLDTSDATIRDLPLSSFSYYIAVTPNGTSSTDPLVNFNGTDDLILYPNDSNAGVGGPRLYWRDRGGNISNVTWVTSQDGRPVVYGVQWDGTTCELYYEDTPVNTSVSAGTEGPFANFTLGFSAPFYARAWVRSFVLFAEDKGAERATIMDALRGGSVSSLAADYFTYNRSTNVIAATGDVGTEDADDVREPSNVIIDPDDSSDYRYKFYYTGVSATNVRVMILCSSPDGETWTNRGVVHSSGVTEDPYVINLGSGVYWAYCEISGSQSKLLTSSDYGRTWTNAGTVSITAPGATTTNVTSCTVHVDGDDIWMFVEDTAQVNPPVCLIKGSVAGGGLEFDEDYGVMFDKNDVPWAYGGSTEACVPDGLTYSDGTWYMFFHYNGSSNSAGYATASSLTGPWTVANRRFPSVDDLHPWVDSNGVFATYIPDIETVVYRVQLYEWPTL